MNVLINDYYVVQLSDELTQHGRRVLDGGGAPNINPGSDRVAIFMDDPAPGSHPWLTYIPLQAGRLDYRAASRMELQKSHITRIL